MVSINKKKVLIIAPHPDDEVLGCGGTILKHLYNNDFVAVCTVSVRNVPLFDKKDSIQQYSESQNAHKVLGINESIMLDFDSVMLDKIPHNELNRALENVLRRVRPDTVYIPFIGDIHLDHKLVAESVLVACRPIYDDKPLKIMMYETPSETEWGVSETFTPNIYVDISKFISKKINAMNQYKSQLKKAPHPRALEKIVALAAFRGGSVCVQYAESFMLVREIITD